MRSKDVSREVLELIGKKGLDVLLLQEPYIQKQAGSSTYSVKGLGVAMRIAAVSSEYPWAAIAVCNPLLHITFISQLSNAHCVCAEIRAPGFSFYVVSHYFQWSYEFEEHLSHLNRVLFALRGKKVLVGADTNAVSTLWGPKNVKTNARGIKLEKLIYRLEIEIINKAHQGPTYTAIQRASYIDVTLASPSIARLIADKRWRVRDSWTTSDHNAINIRLQVPKGGAQGSNRINQRTVQSQRFNTRKADWDRFVKTLNRLSANRLEPLALTNKEEVETMARTLTSVLYEACTVSMPQKRRFRASNP